MPDSGISVASRARIHHSSPAWRSGIRLENTAPDQDVTGRSSSLFGNSDASPSPAVPGTP